MTVPKSYYRERAPSAAAPGRWLSTADMCLRFDKSPLTIAKYVREVPGFPQPVRYRASGPLLWDPQVVDEYERTYRKQARNAADGERSSAAECPVVDGKVEGSTPSAHPKPVTMSTPMKIVQIQYVPETKREHALLILLDDTGRVWFANNPFYTKDTAVWHQLALPDELEWADPE